ncbi:hypothetical protein GCM10023340_02580 [Nocardioides marinquilinus]|uniref:Uncharacterized protein n=1 Tax=Nocardioides marinquilinus TaxID=1210400 RepID=A0ABP9P5N3_9ACTN
MYDRMTVQAEVDYRRERLAKGKPVKRRRHDRVRIPFVGGPGEINGRTR